MNKLLLVTTRFPWPLTNGFANKNYWLIRGLCMDFSIELHVVQRGHVSNSDFDQIAPFCAAVHVYRPGLLDVLFGLVPVVLRDLPIQLALFKSAKARRAIRVSLDTADVAISSVIRGVQYLDDYQGPTVFDLADSLGQLYVRDSKNLSGIKRLVYGEEGRRMLRYEREAVRRSGQTLFFNASEAAHYDPESVTVVPHGVDPRLFEVSAVDSRFCDGVVIFGRMNFEPNVHATEWFVESVLGLLPNHIRLYVVGADPSPRVVKLSERNPRVVVTGFMEDPYPMLRGALACICPIRIGGGIQNKVIEGLAVGAVVVVSPLAAQPMQDIDKSGLTVCDTPQQWAEVIMKILDDPHYFESQRSLGRHYAREHFSWESYAIAVKQSIVQATNRRP
jgi:glycosyltransferase involved in cell wall biosynthesis